MKRESLIVYGDCQAYAVLRVLHCIRAVAERFELKFHSAETQEQNYFKQREEIRESSLIFLQDLPIIDRYPFNYLSNDLRPPAIFFPPITLPSLWPFSVEFAGRDVVAERLWVSRNEKEGLHYFDTFLGLLRCIPDKEKRYLTYKNLSDNEDPTIAKFLRTRNIQRIHELDSLRLKDLDRRFGLSIGSYILDNFRKTRLFHTVRHPAVGLLYVLVKEILNKSSLPCDLSRPLLDSLSYYQIPIHPAVARALNLVWATPDLKYTIYNTHLTFERYAERYMDEFG